MGTQSSSPKRDPPVVPQIKLTDKPWRNVYPWDEKLQKRILRDIEQIDILAKPSLLFVGPVCAGKSAFINSVLSICNGFKVDIAQTGSGSKSYTTSYETFTDETLLRHFSLRDSMGIEAQENEGFHVDDMVMLLTGHIKDGYRFNPRSQIDKKNKHYRSDPQFCHKTHCVVFVIDAVVVDAEIPEQYVHKIRMLQEEIKKLSIPRVVILTKIDKLCGEVEKENSMMFKSVKVRDVVKKTSELFHIPVASIHPVKNYEEDIELRKEISIPILLALRQMVQYADMFVKRMLSHKKDDDEDDDEDDDKDDYEDNDKDDNEDDYEDDDKDDNEVHAQ